MSEDLKIARAMIGCLRQRKNEIERILFSVNTDPQVSQKEAAEIESVYSNIFKGMLDLVEGVETKTGVTIAEQSDKKLDWRRFTMARHMSEMAVRNV